MRIDRRDNVEVNLENGHKYAIAPIAEGEAVIKYGQVIGLAKCPIGVGEHVHSHNLRSALSGRQEYAYTPADTAWQVRESDRTFMGYVRPDGRVGIRNEVWIVNTVGCVNKTAERLAALTGAKHFPHPFGCSQLGDDHATTQKILAGLVDHPNAAGVLVLGLGCENNNVAEFKKVLGTWDDLRVKFLIAQECEDEIAEGVKLIGELKAYADTFTPQPVPVAKLRVGLKCGGSDGFSGITANPLLGRFCDRLTAMGGSCALTEVPEMFGAEHLLMARCVSEEIFQKTVELVNGFKDYFERHGEPVDENPSPGNKEGGITTLAEKSLGCIQKGGTSPVVDVLTYGDRMEKNGLSLVNGPGNDLVAITNLTAAGAHLILFTTGRGTPLGGPVPTVKVATNSDLARKKAGWIDFNAGPILDGEDLDDAFFEYVLSVASGAEAKNEQNGYCEISIFKDGIVL